MSSDLTREFFETQEAVLENAKKALNELDPRLRIECNVCGGMFSPNDTFFLRSIPYCAKDVVYAQRMRLSYEDYLKVKEVLDNFGLYR